MYISIGSAIRAKTHSIESDFKNKTLALPLKEIASSGYTDVSSI
jgi:hypothetical protein